jgi:hypothetical protein
METEREPLWGRTPTRSDRCILGVRAEPDVRDEVNIEREPRVEG